MGRRSVEISQEAIARLAEELGPAWAQLLDAVAEGKSLGEATNHLPDDMRRKATDLVTALARLTEHIKARRGEPSRQVAPGITTFHPVCAGKPCLEGTRLFVAVVLGALAAGDPPAAICEAYRIRPAHIRQIVAYAKALVEEAIRAAAEQPARKAG